jgi:hypothetical protein
LGDGQFHNWHDPLSKSEGFRRYFGVSEVYCESWVSELFSDPLNPLFNEQFIGAHSLVGEYPHLSVDYGSQSLLDTRYPRFVLDTSHIMQGLPEVGVCTRTPSALSIYLYISRHGDDSFFQGRPCAVAQQVNDMRTACFLFTPLAMDADPMQRVFTRMLGWLGEKFDAKSSINAGVGDSPSSAELAQCRNRIDQFLNYLSNSATDEERERYGVALKPFQIEPGSTIE